MDAWARALAGRARFVCVCVSDGGGAPAAALAERFATDLRLRDCGLAYVTDARRDGPHWGQLGCNGFIIADAQHRIVRAKTSAFLEVRERAFREVEAVLAPLLAAAATDGGADGGGGATCLLYTSPSPRDKRQSRMPSSA